VPELVGDRLEILAREQHQGGSTVLEIVQPYRRQASLLDEIAELVSQVGRGQRLAVLVREDPPAGRDPGLGELPVLPAAMRTQDDNSLRVQSDRAETRFRLQRA